MGEHYEVIRKIGEGSFGVIYLGTRSLLFLTFSAGKTDLCKDMVAIKFVFDPSTFLNHIHHWSI